MSYIDFCLETEDQFRAINTNHTSERETYALERYVVAMMVAVEGAVPYEAAEWRGYLVDELRSTFLEHPLYKVHYASLGAVHALGLTELIPELKRMLQNPKWQASADQIRYTLKCYDKESSND